MIDLEKKAILAEMWKLHAFQSGSTMAEVSSHVIKEMLRLGALSQEEAEELAEFNGCKLKEDL